MEATVQKKRGRPPVFAVPLTINITPEQSEILRRYAAMEGVSVSSAMRGLLTAIEPALQRSVEAFEAAKAEPSKGVQLAAKMLEDGALALKAGQRQLELMR